MEEALTYACVSGGRKRGEGKRKKETSLSLRGSKTS